MFNVHFSMLQMLKQALFRLMVCVWWSCILAQINLSPELELKAQKKKLIQVLDLVRGYWSLG